MKAKTLSLESRLLRTPVIRLVDWYSVEEPASYSPSHLPVYVYCELDATELEDIHQLEDAGYRFSEFRIKSTLNTSEAEYSTRALHPFIAEIITEKSTLSRALGILNQNPCDDRFSNDPVIPPDFTTKRNNHNLKKSFSSWPNEFLLGIFNSYTKELIAFRSGAILNKTEAQLFQYGIATTNDYHHTAGMLEAFTIQYLRSRGIQYIHAISTGFNIPELNRLTQNHHFRITSSTVLLRKLIKTT
jgi:hypothetical protein